MRSTTYKIGHFQPRAGDNILTEAGSDLLFLWWNAAKVQKNIMQIVELIKISDKILETLSNYGIKTSDYRHLSLYNDYADMVKNNEKITYIVASLARKYGLSESTVYRVIKRFSNVVKF